MLILLFIISLISYLVAPDTYSFVFCVYELILFLVSAFFFYRKMSSPTGMVNFHFFFLFSFFFVNFVYPVFLYPIDAEYFFMFSFNFDENNISKGTALAQLAITSYMVGVNLFTRKYEEATSFDFTKINPNFVTVLNVLFVLSTLMYLYSVITAGDNDIVINYQVVVIYVGLLSLKLLLKAEIYKAEFVDSTRFFLQKYWFELISVLIVVLFSLWFGDRGPVLQIGLILLYVYTVYVKRLSAKTLTLLIVVGFVVMSFISYTRSTDSNLKDSGISGALDEGGSTFSSFVTVWDYAMDFIVNNRALYVGYEIVDENGFLYGKSYFPYFFSPVPGLPVLITQLVFDEDPEDFSTAVIISEREGVYDWGLGTNAVADGYMNFGVVGVLLMFLAFGYLIRFLELSNSFYAKFLFVSVMSYALYFPRTTLIVFAEPLRIVLFFWILVLIFNYKVKTRE